jgi:hypothetical protein
MDSETESDERPIIFKRPKPSTKGPHLEQNIKQNTDFYKNLKEVKMLGGTKKKRKKSTKTKLSEVSTQGKSYENTTTVSSEAPILGHDIPLRTILPESEPKPEPEKKNNLTLLKHSIIK